MFMVAADLHRGLGRVLSSARILKWSPEPSRFNAENERPAWRVSNPLIPAFRNVQDKRAPPSHFPRLVEAGRTSARTNRAGIRP